MVELCPDCGSLLEPVAVLAEIVGFRSITSGDGPGAGEAAAEAVALTVPVTTP
jgi:hypothetical protein